MPHFLKKTAQLTFLVITLFAFLGTDQDSRFQTLGHKVMCICGCNQVLLECNHVGCTYSDRMRGELASYVDRGDSDDLTLQAFVQKYGPTVLIAPTTTGFNRVAWIMPYLVLVLGLTTVVLIVRTWRMRPQMLPAGGIGPASQGELERYREQARKDTEV
jgi:cytochrome c-type biogenesis protein CcmH/NrfF